MAKMIKDVVLLTLIFSAILRLSNARGIGKRQAECKPPKPINNYGYGCQQHYCGKTQYYYDKEDDVCKECLSCDIGQQADIHCESQRSGLDVECETCKPGTFSNSRSQGDCDLCTVCVNEVILAECTPTTNTKCGDCLPGFYFHEHVGCDPCSNLSDEKKILKRCPLTTPRTPTTKKVSTTIHTTPTPQPTPKTPISAKEATPTVPTPTVPKISQAGFVPSGDEKHEDAGHLEIANLGVILLGAIFMLAIVIFGMFCIVRTCVSDSNISCCQSSSETSSTGTTAYSDSKGSPKGSNDNSPYASSTESLDKHDKSDIERNSYFVNKKSAEKNCTLQMENIKTQKNPNDTQQSNQDHNLNNLSKDKAVSKQNTEKRKCSISSLKSCAIVQSINNCQQKMDDIRRGEESDQRLEERESLLPLLPDGGVFGSGSGADAPDSYETTSTNNASSESIHSLVSQGNPRMTLKKQNSFDNKAMVKKDDDYCAVSPLLKCNESLSPVMQESSDDMKQAEAVYLSNQQLHHLQSASNQGPGSEDHTPQDSIAKCNIEANQTDRIDNSPPQSPSSANPLAPPILRQPGRSPKQVPVGHGRYIPRTPSPQRPSRLYPLVPSPSSHLGTLSTEVPADIGPTRNERHPSSTTTTTVVHKYYAPVTQYQASYGGQIAVGSHCNQIQQRGHGGGDNQTQPRTPEGSVPCSDDFRATYPPDGNLR